MKNVAVLGCTLKLSSDLYGGVIAITSLPSTSITAMNKNVYFGSIDGTIAGCVDETSGCVQGAPVTFSIKGTGTNVEIDTTGIEKKVVLEGDESQLVSIVLTHPTTGATITIALSVKVESAGQTEVTSN
ncbi:MAG: hypothetical protein MJ176_03405 [Treponema sp.]|nr:hypothetical protein [Treponema sp.]